MNYLTAEQLEDVKRRYREKGRILVTTHELGDLLYMVGDLQAGLNEMTEKYQALQKRYSTDLTKFRRIATIVTEGENYGPTAI